MRLINSDPVAMCKECKQVFAYNPDKDICCFCGETIYPLVLQEWKTGEKGKFYMVPKYLKNED